MRKEGVDLLFCILSLRSPGDIQVGLDLGILVIVGKVRHRLKEVIPINYSYFSWNLRTLDVTGKIFTPVILDKAWYCSNMEGFMRNVGSQGSSAEGISSSGLHRAMWPLVPSFLLPSPHFVGTSSLLIHGDFILHNFALCLELTPGLPSK